MFSSKFCTVRSFKHSYLYNVKKHFHSLYFQDLMSLFQNKIRFNSPIKTSIHPNRKHYLLTTKNYINIILS
ncbi:hypothetical protein COL93_21030 [Bacillus toyonensis]|uniref:Uncharacterized protein n=1 Tax=Bacillus toyonensis TaxID=155322 RepID=A0A2B5XEL3_9BACI|nr:hypothetical protein COL93_21030 [Bacillus toyonensis]PHD70662.1 hypothetical protein COF40_10770 [Bacillus toyonensis]